MKILDLSYTDIGPEGAEKLANALQVEITSGTSPVSLNFISLSLSPPSLSLTHSLTPHQFNSSISTLLLNGCKIGYVGGIQVASMLQVNRSIVKLGLSSCDLDTDCLIAMSTVLHGNQAIQQLDLSRPLLHSRMEETTIHISKMLQVLDFHAY